jgi:hypothetical protein
LIPETVCRFVDSNYAHREGSPLSLNALSIAKLHGSIDKGNIVPPTWNKTNNPEIIPAWKRAYQLLAQANHIRIIGYSLPIADTYVKYLLKSAVVSSEHLKMIDVICLDPDGSVKARYDDFISFRYYQFFDRSAEQYLEIVKANSRGGEDKLVLNRLETAHRSFCNL